MTRWARRNGGAGAKALEATPWEELAGGPGGRGCRSGPPSLRKKSRKKKEYLNEDVNGFAAHLRQGGEAAGGAGSEGEAAAAWRKDKRREGRRLKRQEMRKNAMVSFALGPG